MVSLVPLRAPAYARFPAAEEPAAVEQRPEIKKARIVLIPAPNRPSPEARPDVSPDRLLARSVARCRRVAMRPSSDVGAGGVFASIALCGGALRPARTLGHVLPAATRTSALKRLRFSLRDFAGKTPHGPRRPSVRPLWPPDIVNAPALNFVLKFAPLRRNSGPTDCELQCNAIAARAR